jgi:3-oxoacyl-[acyl-carrier-protein] synthase II
MSERDSAVQTAAGVGQQRIVVTGVGAVTPLGPDVPDTWTALLEGRCGISRIEAFDTGGFSTRIAAEVRDFDAPGACDLTPKDARRLDRFVLLGLAAAREAVADAGLPLPLPDGDRCGVYVGSGMGGLVTLSEQFDVLRRRGPDRVSPFLVPMMICDMASGQISISLGARGPNMAVVSACATGAHAIGEGAAAIRDGRADVILAGGAEAVITPIGIAGFAAARALSTRNDEPQRASRPFDRERDGFVMGEGAAVVVLEREDLARRRGARIYAEVAGYGASADAYHLTAPPESGEGAVRCMRQALAGAGLDPSGVDYLNAHGTSTPLNDRAETAAIKAAFGAAAGSLAISSTKGAMGHLLGAAGSVEAVVAIKAIESGVVPPTLNYEHPDPACDLDYTPNRAHRLAVRTAMTNSFGFGGHNATLLFRAVEDGRRAA